MNDANFVFEIAAGIDGLAAAKACLRDMEIIREEDDNWEQNGWIGQRVVCVCGTLSVFPQRGIATFWTTGRRLQDLDDELRATALSAGRFFCSLSLGLQGVRALGGWMDDRGELLTHMTADRPERNLFFAAGCPTIAADLLDRGGLVYAGCTMLSPSLTVDPRQRSP